MKTAILINEILKSIVILIKNIKTLLTDVKKLFKKNIYNHIIYKKNKKDLLLDVSGSFRGRAINLSCFFICLCFSKSLLIKHIIYDKKYI